MFRNLLLFLTLFSIKKISADECVTIDSENEGEWSGHVMLGPWNEDVSGWSVIITFTGEVLWIDSIVGDVSGGGDTWTLSSKEWDSDIPAGQQIELRFIVGYSGDKPGVLSVTSVTEGCNDEVIVTDEAEGEWTGKYLIQASNEPINGWDLQLVFSAPLDYLDCIAGSVTGSGSVWTISSKDWDSSIPAGGQLEVNFIVLHSQPSQPSVIRVQLNDDMVCGGGDVCYEDPPPGPDHCDGDYIVEDEVQGQSMKILVNIVPQETVSDWNLQIQFDSPVLDISSPLAEASGSGSSWLLSNKEFDGDLEAGTNFELRFFVYYSGTKPNVLMLVFNSVDICSDETHSEATTGVSKESTTSTSTTQAKRSEDLFNPTPLVSSNPPWDSESHPKRPGSLWGSLSRPYPTNVWWQNIVNDPGDLVNVANPFQIKTLEDGLHVCLPYMTVQPNYVLAGYLDNLVMTAQEGLGGHTVTKYDELSVTVTWESGFETPIVRGMPYATVFYNGLTPVLKFGHAILSNSGSGKRYEVTLNNQQKWIIYASSEISFSQSGDDLVASGPFSGSIRAAAVWDGGEGDVATLDAHADKIPIGGTVSAEVSGDIAYMNFNWETSGSGDLLIMALPHHLDTIITQQTSHRLKALKGEMVGISGDVWEFEEPLTDITWGAPRSVAEDKVGMIREALQNDIPNEQVPGDDPYFGGKKMALFARLSLIADEIGEAGLAQQARDRVKEFIEGWLGGTNPNKLLYEDVWGGVVSSCGLHDEQCDFGNGMYNDHHFHYGYHIYTAAVLAKSDPAWGQQWEERVLHMISDVAEPSRTSQWYPFTRTKDWYDGHAWASGIFPFADGKNQESTSESLNGWYAIYLWGLVTDNARVKDLGRLMTGLEIRAAQRYWQMNSDYSAYPAPFSDHKAVGIVWSTKADYATWFGGNVEFIHCIQMLPFVPISEELLREEWIQEEYEVLREAYNRPDPPLSEGWKGYVVMAHAIIDPQAAFDEALNLSGYDDGNTKSNTLWWIATRPGMGGGPTEPPVPTDYPPSTTTTISTTTTTAEGGCCGPNSFTDARCNDIANDPFGGLGCAGCGIQDCRLCGEGPYPACE